MLPLLSGCGAGRKDAAFRDGSQPLTVTTRADFSALEGSWFVRAQLPDNQNLAGVRFGPDDGGTTTLEYTADTCLSGNACAPEIRRATLESLGPRRTRDSETGREFWLVWIDEGLRTAAIGTPDGSFGWILDRAQAGGEDRIAAAREILEFNGYDVSAFTVRKGG